MPSQSKLTEAMLAGDSEMHKRVRDFDWGSTAIGNIERWPSPLKTAVGICLDSRYPMFVIWGQEDLALFYNDAYRPMLGQTKHPQYLGGSMKDCWSEIWDVVGPLVDTVFNTGKSSWCEKHQLNMFRNNYLEEAYFTYSYSPIQDEDGNVGGMFCALSEDTKDVLNTRRFRTLRDLSGDPKTMVEAAAISANVLGQNSCCIPFSLIYLLDQSQKVASLHGISGIPVNTIYSRDLVHVGTAEDNWQFAAAISGQAQFVTGLVPECVPKEPWPEPPQHAYIVPIHGIGQARVIGVLIVGISSRRVFDEDYKHFLESAAGHIATLLATGRAYEEEKHRAETLAELDRAKTAFFSNVSHEFRTPLTLILGPLQTAIDSSNTPEPERLELITAHRNGLRLLKLVNSLLDFSRIEAGRIEAVYEPTDLCILTTDLASTFRSAIEKAGLSLIVECQTLSHPAYVDRDMWEKIVLNLVSNAFKFTLEGTITIRLKEVRNKITLTVADTGCGIAEDEQPHIFERFHRARVAKARTHEGTGIGLALVDELVKLHGGKVKVKSKTDEGATFTVTIPTSKDHLPKERLGAERQLQSTATGAAPYVEEATRWLGPVLAESLEQVVESSVHGRNEDSEGSASVVVVDDNADMREYIERLLKPYWNVVSIADGLSAWDVIVKTRPNLVLADVMMPGLDGFQLLQRIRETDETKTIPVIMLSARAGEESRIEGLNAGADEYLSKPFSARELLASVKTNLKLAKLRNSLAIQLVSEVADRTADAEKANDELRSIAHLISEQIQEPANIIASYLKLLAVRYKGRLGKDADEFIEKCTNGSKAVSRMVDDLWHYSRADKPGLPSSSAALEDSFSQVLRDLSEQITVTKSLIEKQDLLPIVICKVDQIEYVIKSLVTNAMTFSRPGAVPEIHVSCVDNGHEWLFCVQDNGIGLDSMDSADIFNPFTRLNNKRPDADGTGMGLAIARKIVTAHKGWIWVESEVGKGAKFFFTLPKTPLET